ncbi:uncharacterized protein LOC125488692 [Plutella xylostella]|uniref:uncharacterized protein LOC125488692 n=1 Tax=Plutella xylostella TaxID=51655 RepID=UPI002032CE24|nr:uncharacterized protein LOC125488692 [Plutella xylostella]
MYFSFIGCVAIFSIDAFLALIVFQIIGHFQILKHNMENLPRPKTETAVFIPGMIKNNVYLRWYDDDENKYINRAIIQMMNHHKYIMRCVDEISSFFGPILGLNYMFHLVNLCVLFLECIRCEHDDLLRNLCVLGVSLGNLLVQSITFEIVSAYSEKLIDAVYGMPWESMNISNRKCLMLFLSRVQDPIRVTTIGVVPVGVQTMGSILRTSFSYCTFLLTIE